MYSYINFSVFWWLAIESDKNKEQFKNKSQRKKWEKEKGMIVFSFVKKDPPFNLVDMFIKHPLRFDILYKKRVDVRVKDITVPIAAIDHLIKIKQKAGRNIDLNDIAQLKKLNALGRKSK